MTGDFVLIYHGVTLGKARPGGDPSSSDSMPKFHGTVIFGSNSSVLGSVIAGHRVVFGAHSLCTIDHVPSNHTLVGFNRLVPGVFFDPSAQPQLFPAFL